MFLLGSSPLHSDNRSQSNAGPKPTANAQSVGRIVANIGKHI